MVRRLAVTLLALVWSSCGGGDDGELFREVVDCADDATVCNKFQDSGCSVDLTLVDAEGQVVGVCGEGDERRVCSIHCEGDGECPEGWLCQLPERCPGDNTIRFCVPTASELQMQEIADCRAVANPRVCGFF